MQKILLIIISALCFLFTNAQRPYWQQKVDYAINAQLNDEVHTLDGFLKLKYINNSPDTLRFIWFHVWPNAYKNDKTAFSDQLLENGRTDFYFSDNPDRGYINRLDFRVNESLAKTEDHPEHIDIIKLLLNEPLRPGDSVHITTPFHVQLPKNFSRSGHIGKSYQIAQWYPKPAVYDAQGWHPMPYLDQGEFYAEFGDYTVDITLPQTYQVLSSGQLLNPEQDIFIPSIKLLKNSKTLPKLSNSVPDIPPKTLRFKQQNIHDFAWFASPDYILMKDSVMLSSGRNVQLSAAYFPSQKELWKNAMSQIKEALLQRSTLIGEYPYDHLSVVQSPTNNTYGGMEYPCIATISKADNEADFHEVIAHEIGHNWFQGAVANNERKYAWMDEGLNTYYEKRLLKQKDKYHLFNEALVKMLWQTYSNLKIDQPVNTPSSELSQTNYYLSSYYKSAKLFNALEKKMGRAAFDTAINRYYKEWKFRHPQPDDLFATLQSHSSTSLDTLIHSFDQKGPLPLAQKEKLRFGILSPKTISHTNAVIASPAGGYNMYDGWMVGGILTNYQLPPKKFQFLLAPLYATESRSLNYAFRLGYTFFPKKIFSHIHFSLSGMKFSKDDYKTDDNRKYITGFQKLVPSVKLILNNDNPRSTLERYIQWKSFWIEEGRLQFRSDSVVGVGRVLNIQKEIQDRWLHQLQLVLKDNRVLYPYEMNAMMEYANDFTRLTFTGRTYLNYNSKQGASVRFFAGKFLYNGTFTTSKFFRTNPFHLNLTGPRGNEDYTYSNYFIGRNEFEGFASQQIMMRDGGFKVRTDLLADKIGKTDDWLMAINFVTDIPERLNILNVLPVKIPLQLFLDIGTYADTWKEGYQGSKILYNAGLQIPMFNNVVKVHIPLLYSSVYDDYINSTITGDKFLNTISFSIDIQELSLKKLDKNIPY